MSENSVSSYIYASALLVILSFCTGEAAAQAADPAADTVTRGKYALVAYVGGGFSRFAGDAGTPSGFSATVNKNGVAGTLRILWHPDHRLRFGIETGWTNFYSYDVQGGSNTAKVNLTGVPVLLVFSMPLTKQLSVFAGSGAYLLTSDLDYAGKVNSSAFSVGFMASVMYTVPLSQRLSLGTELKWFNARETRDTALSLQLMVIWKFYQW